MRRWLLFLVVAGVILSGCAEDPSLSRDFDVDRECINLSYSGLDVGGACYTEMPDGMPCVIYSSSGGGGISCDWDYQTRR